MTSSSSHGLNRHDQDSQRSFYFLERESKPAFSSQYYHDLQRESKVIPGLDIPFVSLLGGEESVDSVRARWLFYNQSWNRHQERVEEILRVANERAVNEIRDFVLEPWDDHPDARISTAVVLPGSNIANHINLFDRMKTVLQDVSHVHLASISSKNVVNLKTGIAFIVKSLTENEEITEHLADSAEDVLHYDKRLRYDFDILAEWCRAVVRKDESLRSLHDMRVVISVDDAHSFDIGVLTALIRQLQSYITQIPVKIVLSVATSIDVFQENLRRSCIRMIHGMSINAHLTGCLEEVILETILEANNETDVLIGPNTFRNIVRRQRESLESIDSFVSALKYNYMTYFYSNPLSVIPSLLASNTSLIYPSPYLNAHHYDAIRLLPSFKKYVQSNIKENPTEMVRILDDNEQLHMHIQIGVTNFLEYKARVMYGIMILEALQQFVYFEKQPGAPSPLPVSRIDLYSAALLGEIPASDFYVRMKQNLAKSSLSALSELLRLLKPERPAHVWPSNVPVPKAFAGLYYSILEKQQQTLAQFLDMEDDFSIVSGSLRTQEQAIKFVSTFRAVAAMFFQTLDAEVFPDPKASGEAAGPASYKGYFLHELFITDTPSLHDNVFVPTYRAAIEMALSKPKHYWGNIAEIAARDRQKALYEAFLRNRQGAAPRTKKQRTAVGGELDPSLLLLQPSAGALPGESLRPTAAAAAAAARNTEAATSTAGNEEDEESEELAVVPAENEWAASAMAYDPHLCVMYTLYRESSMYINIYDFFTAFSSVIRQPQDEEDPAFERKALAWFLQGVAELKLLGIIRDSKRKFECVEKLVWRGL